MIREEILKELRRADAYLSGQELSEKLGVSRTAVWKAVTRLKEEGYEIDSVPNKGYRLLGLPDVMTEAEIGSRLKTAVMGRNCICFSKTDSTNIQARKLAEKGAVHGTLVCADRQTAGRGRRGRTWTSPSGDAVYMSLILRPDIRPEHASMLTLIMGLAAASACNELLRREGGEEMPRVEIKWPNDLVLEGKKLSGTLTEMSAEIDGIHYVIIGTGINVNTERFPEELTQAVSLKEKAGKRLMRAELIALCMEAFEKYYGIFEKTEDFRSLKEEYNRLLVNTGREVRILEQSGEYTGTALGVNERGELLVKCPDGHTEEIYAGEVSVRGVYGYV